MKRFRNATPILYMLAGLTGIMLTNCSPGWIESEADGFHIIKNVGGQVLGYSPESGISILTVAGYGFKDLNKNGDLDPYEDWRLPGDERAADLASRMSVEQIAGLMLYSSHQRIPGGGFGGRDTYSGKSFKDSGASPSDLTDQQKKFLKEDHVRHILMTSVESPEVAARWNNHVQAMVEGFILGIPANNSSDPRHQAEAGEEYTAGAGGEISRWPGSIGLAATFDPALVEAYGKIASREYRALGITTALSPQIDLATDPRWSRFSGTFGPDPSLSADMARAYVSGFQSSSPEQEISGGWGYESVNTMIKHWPGGGTGEGGRDAHYGFGKFGVYPGDNLQIHLKPFIDGALKLNGETRMAAAVMPYYTISYNQNPSGENVGNSYSKFLITDLLREKYGFDGVVCTDWGVTHDEEGMAGFGRTPWGVEGLSEADRHYLIIMAGCDQFGGNNDVKPVLEAYRMGVEEHGEAFMRSRFEQSAKRLLLNMFRVGLFENPYLDTGETNAIVGNPEFMRAGYEAQLKSIVLLKNSDHLMPVEKKKAVYIPRRYVPASRNFFGNETPARWEDPIDTTLVRKYFTIAADPSSADFVIVVIHSPENGRTAGYSMEDVQAGGNGFVPISLQYDRYTASMARDHSIAGDSREKDVLNRTYKNKSVTAKNKSDLDQVLKYAGRKTGKPEIVILRMNNPAVVREFEKYIDGLIIDFGVQDQALLDMISGVAAPSGLLPLQIPADMATVETQQEDVPFDMKPYVDSEGNIYNFGFGLNWKGVIRDDRTARYQIR